MSAITGLGDDDAERVRAQFGVSQIQVERDHVISVILSALMELKDSLTFFGGTALARTHLPAGRLSEDIDLLAMGDRRTTADELVTQINRSVLPRYGRLTWSADLAALRDVEPVTLTTDAGITIQLQLLIATGYPNWPTEVRRIEQRYSDVAPTQLRVPTLDSFVAWKAIAWFDRATPRDLYDLWLLSNEKMITRTASELFAALGSTGAAPSREMFIKAPTEGEWNNQLSGQTRLTVTASEALTTVREAWSAAGTLGPHV